MSAVLSLGPEVWRATARERQRTSDLIRLVPDRGHRALDVGARDGHFSRLLAERFGEVVALDLERPDLECAGVQCVAGDVTRLDFPDEHFDFVLCAEVLEHVPPASLEAACRELVRVCGGRLLIGVPDRQDLRLGRTTCSHCGRENPPWGHVTRFDAASLRRLFDGSAVREVSCVGTTDEVTNALSAWLMSRAGNPYGTYEQDEPCLHCGSPLGTPRPRNLARKILTKVAFAARALSAPAPRAQWIHMLFETRPTGSPDVCRVAHP